MATVQTIDDSNSRGDPDTNGNGFGIGVYEFYSVYTTPMVLMAIIASNGPTNITTTGPTNVVGRTYHDVAVDIVDWIAWAQNSVAANGPDEGGWRYYPQFGSSDNSISQWTVIGLMAAQLWGINAPSWVPTELQKWITADQDLSGTCGGNPTYGAFDYALSYGWYTPADSAAGILELTYTGADNTDSRILAAEAYLYNQWAANGSGNGWDINIGDLYDMYAIMKAMTLTTPTATTLIPDCTGSNHVEWYNGPGQYADSLLAQQSSDGHWDNWVVPPETQGSNLATAFGVLILEYVPIVVIHAHTLTVHVVDNDNNPISGADVSVVGPTTLNGVTAGGTAVFINVPEGSYTVTASKIGYLSASQGMNMNQDREITLVLTSTSPPTGVPEFGIPSAMVAAITLAAFALFTRLRKPQILVNTR
jgi:hypothetical protein